MIPLLATLLWGSNFLVGKNILHHVPPFTLGFLRWSFALIVLLPFTWKSLCENWEFYLKFWREILIMGFLGIALFTGLVYWGMEHTNTVNASLLSSLSPIFITIVAYFMLHERINSNQIIGILLSLLGVLWIVSKGHIGTFADIRLNNGDIVLILSNVLMAIYSVMLRKTADRLPGLIGFTLIVFAGVLTSVPLMMVEVSFRPVQLFLWENLWSIAYLGIFFIGNCFLLLDQDSPLFRTNKSFTVYEFSTGFCYYVCCVVFERGTALFSDCRWSARALGCLLVIAPEKESCTNFKHESASSGVKILTLHAYRQCI